jgi:hypothetical protein
MKAIIFFSLFLPCCLLISSCEFLYRERLDIYKKSLIAAPFYCTKLSCRPLYPPCFNTNEKSVINDSLKLIKLEFNQTNVRLTNAHYIYEHYLDTMTCNYELSLSEFYLPYIIVRNCKNYSIYITHLDSKGLDIKAGSNLDFFIEVHRDLPLPDF